MTSQTPTMKGNPMRAVNDNLNPPRSGLLRLVPPREYRHPRGWASARIGGGIVLVGAGVLTLAFGGNDTKTYGWTAFWLVLAVPNLTVGYQEVLVARHQAAARA
jgi:hypothetical protein